MAHQVEFTGVTASLCDFSQWKIGRREQHLCLQNSCTVDVRHHVRAENFLVGVLERRLTHGHVPCHFADRSDITDVAVDILTQVDHAVIAGRIALGQRAHCRMQQTAELEKQGFETVYIDVDRNCRLDEKQLEAAINDETILVSLMHVNNEAGTIMPVDKVKNIMKAKNAPGIFHTDAVQSYVSYNAPLQTAIRGFRRNRRPRWIL